MRFYFKIQLFLFLLIFSSFFIMCGSEDSSSPISSTTDLTINVTDEGGNPLYNVKATLTPGNIVRYSNNDGQILYIALDEGNYSVTFEKATYQDKTETIDLLTTRNTFNFIMDLIDPELALNKSLLNFDSQNLSNTITISNASEVGTINWTFSSDKNWLTSNLQSGSIINTQTISLSITVNTTELDYGIHTGNFTISSNAGNITVPVELDVFNSDSSWLAVPTESLLFDFNDVTKTVTLRNIGMYATNWSVSSKPDWITVSSSSGNLIFKEQKDIVLTADRSAQSAGTNTGTITFAGSENSVVIPITINISSNQPSILSIGEVTYESAKLNWTQSGAAGFHSYKLYRSTSANVTESATLITTITDRNTLTYTDESVAENSQYYYALYTYLGDGRNSKSNEVIVSTPSSTPPQFYVYSLPFTLSELYAFDVYDNVAYIGEIRNISSDDSVFDPDDGYYYYYPKIAKHNGTSWSWLEIGKIGPYSLTESPNWSNFRHIHMLNENIGFITSLRTSRTSLNYSSFYLQLYKFNSNTKSIFYRENYDLNKLHYMNYPFYTVFALSENEAWIGATNKFFKYFNGELISHSSSGIDYIRDIKFKDGIGYAVTTNGQLLINSGGTWSIVSTRISGGDGGAEFYTLEVLAPNNIWIIGHQTWGGKGKSFFHYNGTSIEIVNVTESGDDNFNSSWGDISFIDENDGWAVYYDKIFRFSNGDWEQIANPIGTGNNARLFRVRAVNSNSVWISTINNSSILHYR